jgi:hypothetical protein
MSYKGEYVNSRLTLTILIIASLQSLCGRPLQAASNLVDAPSLLAGMSTSFSTGKAIDSLQLSGSFTRYAGSDTNTGAITLFAESDGTNKTQIELPQGSLVESQGAAADDRSCEWVGTDTTRHDASGLNCWRALVWFLPQITLHPARLSSILGTSYKGLMSTPNGDAYVLENQLIVGPGKTPSNVTARIQKASTTSLQVDPQTLLPRNLQYTLLSDSGTATISVEVRYTNYQFLSGLTIPRHIERYLNGSLELAIDIDQVTILK